MKKIRMDFVTNSSSSSYLIAYKDNPILVDEKTKEKYPWVDVIAKGLYEFIADSTEGYETQEADILRDEEDVELYFKHNYGYKYQYAGKDNIIELILASEGDDVRNLYNMMIEKIKDGYIIMDKEIGYSNKMLTKLVESLAEGEDDFVILDSCEA